MMYIIKNIATPVSSVDTNRHCSVFEDLGIAYSKAL